MTESFSIGSEWRRWDLHIHSPESVLENQFTNWTDYIQSIRSADTNISVIGITDYASIEGYKRLRDEKNNGEIPNIDEIFPNIEFRITPQTENNKGINIHIIVDPSDSDHIEKIEKALSRLVFKYQGENFSCNLDELRALGQKFLNDESSSNEQCLKEGVNQFKPSFESFRDWYINEGWLSKNSLIGVANSSSDGASGIQQDNGLQATRDEIYRFSDFIFSGNPRCKKYFLGEGVDSEQVIIEKKGSLKPCLHGSDGHSNLDIFNPDLSRNCWIKADPNFNGFRQVCYEPKERVQIQENNPAYDIRKRCFSQVECDGTIFDEPLPKFKNTKLELNSGLVTLIGGRGTGKSLVLDGVYQVFHSSLDDMKLQSFNVDLMKTDDSVEKYSCNSDANFEYLHVRQGDIKKIANNPDELSKELKKLLNIPSGEDKPEYDYQFQVLIERIEKSLAWTQEKDSEGNLVNDLSVNTKTIQINQNLVSTITTDQNRDNIESYQTNSRYINSRKLIESKLNELGAKLVSAQTDLNRDISEINSLDISGQSISNIDVTKQLSEITGFLEQIRKDIAVKGIENEKIENEFKQQGIDQDIGGLLGKLELYQKEIDKAGQKISEYEKRISSIESDVNERTELVSEIKKDFDARVKQISSTFETLKQGKDTWTDDQKLLVSDLLESIKVEGYIKFDKVNFYKGLSPLLNGNKFRSTDTETTINKIEAKFNVRNFEDYLRLLKNEEIIDDGDGQKISLNQFTIQKDYFRKDIFDIYEYLYLHSYRNQYLNVVPIIEYLGKKPNKLSVGQRGTFYVCMKLATDPFGSPFIFDQPEDDLDNKFIMEKLVPLFRRIKQYRQVIIATHNANLVVNADAEQVIVASNESEELGYISGSLENTEIRNHVCEVLEGGQQAFESREKKYGFKQ